MARVWAELLGPGGRFERSFEQVEFAILGGPTFREFRNAYQTTCSQILIEKEVEAMGRADAGRYN